MSRSVGVEQNRESKNRENNNGKTWRARLLFLFSKQLKKQGKQVFLFSEKNIDNRNNSFCQMCFLVFFIFKKEKIVLENN